MLGFYFTPYGLRENLPLFASNHPELVAAVLTACIEHLERLRQEASDPSKAERYGKLLETFLEENSDPAQAVADADSVERVLAQVGEPTAQLLRLCLKGYSATEAARHLGIAPATAWKLLERARKKLQRI